MAGLPTQLRWSKFVCVLKQLGYDPCKSKGGSARSFHNPDRYPPLVTFHEPHGGETIRPGTLRSYVRQLQLKLEKFIELLDNC